MRIWYHYCHVGMSHIRSVQWGVPVRETLVLSHQLFEVGWPVPFLAAFISPVFPPGPHLLLGGQWVCNQPLALCGSRTVVFTTVSKRSNRYATRPPIVTCEGQISICKHSLSQNSNKPNTVKNLLLEFPRDLRKIRVREFFELESFPKTTIFTNIWY